MATNNTASALTATDPAYSTLVAARDETHDWDAFRSAVSAITPTANMGATINGYSDRSSCTIVAVSGSGKQITVRRDSAELLNSPTSGESDALVVTPGGFSAHVSGTQRYAYTIDESGATTRFSRRSVGGSYRWVEVGTPAKTGPTCSIGIRAHYHDYNF